jgi:hypothetical protein
MTWWMSVLTVGILGGEDTSVRYGRWWRYGRYGRHGWDVLIGLDVMCEVDRIHSCFLVCPNILEIFLFALSIVHCFCHTLIPAPTNNTSQSVVSACLFGDVKYN